MAKFKYTLPSGSEFTMEAPAGTTQAQADQIFYEQVAAGSLVGYNVGQTLTSLASKITKFELSRLDRGTAGVDTITILAVIQNLPVVSSIPALINVPINAPINQTDIVLAKGDGLGPNAVGPLSEFQVQTLLAQISNVVDQDSTTITQDKGIGKFGFNCYQLEKAGYIKPGTSARLLNSSPDNFIEVMNSPAVWTGLNGQDSLDTLLSTPDAQSNIQVELMQSGYDSLTATGVISNVPAATVSFSQGQVYTQSGLQTLSALTLLGGSSGLTNIDLLGSSAITNLSTLTSGAVNTLGISTQLLNANNLATSLAGRINGDVGALITNASKYGTQATAAWAAAGGLGTSLSNLVTGNLTGITSVLPTLTGTSLNSITAGLTNLVPGSLGNLNSALDVLGKASQFSLNFSNPLNSIKNLGSVSAIKDLANGALNNVQGQITGALNNVQGQITGIANGALASAQAQAAQLQALASGSLANLKSLGNLFGGSGDLVSGTQIAAGFNNTVNRKTVDAAVARIFGSSKISVPTFEYPSLSSISEKLDIAQAQSILQGLKNQASQAIAQVNQIQNQATQLRSQATQLVGTANRLLG